ncbi:MAG: DUF362 domain-containing protein [Acetobacterium woodii]|nr:DUF362 domain-containing protein [Acetobacterium woodii]MBI5677182.1 DUF362 domain-containing protein [Planctomycetota bacterium]
MKKKVIVDLLKDASEGLFAQVYDASKQIGLEEDARTAKALFIKPNLTYPVFKKGVTTRVEFVKGIVSVLTKINPDLKIFIGEGEGGYNSFSMSDAFRDMGFLEIEKEFPQVKIINLSKIPSKEIEIDTPQGPYNIALPEIFFNEIDFSISCPLPKVHCMTKITLSYKNQWGCLPDVMRLKNHYMFDYIISKVSDILKFRYAFLDGKYGLTNNGPMVGDPIEVNWFVASNSLGAFDMIVSEMMGFNWEEIGHLKMAAKYGFIPSKEDIQVIGDIESLKRKFVLKRNFWNYPALTAFHSPKLTHLFYFSRWAKLLHDVMYTFRKRPIIER